MRQRSSLGHYAAGRKDAGSIHNYGIGYFSWPKQSSRAVAKLVDLASDRNEYQESSLGWGKDCLCLRLTTLSPTVSRLSTKCGSLDVCQSFRPLRFLRDSFTLSHCSYSRRESPVRLLKLKQCTRLSQCQVTNGSATAITHVIGFLHISLGSSTFQLHYSLRSKRACVCSESGFSSQYRDCLEKCTTEEQRAGQKDPMQRIFLKKCLSRDLPCGLVVRVPGYRSRGPDSIPCSTRFSEK
jgi:hypothetical protein